MTTCNCENRKEDLEEIDQELCNKIHFYEDVDELVDTAFSGVTAACNAAFKVSRGLKRSFTKPAVPWWTEELTVLRKRTNALRRRYQRTTNTLPSDHAEMRDCSPMRCWGAPHICFFLHDVQHARFRALLTHWSLQGHRQLLAGCLDLKLQASRPLLNLILER